MTAPALPPEVESVIKGIDPLKAIADWENADDIAHAVKAYVVAQMRPVIARALGGDGEPVAWAVFAEDASVPAYVSSVKDRADQVVDSPAGRDECYRLVPLYTRPAATGDTVGAAARAWDALLAALRSTPGGGACG